MSISFYKVKSAGAPRKSVFHLRVNNWDDYSFKTMFYLIYYDQNGVEIEIGNVKIGYANQPYGWTEESIESGFHFLPDPFFSLGQDVEYYKNLRDNLPSGVMRAALIALRDVAFDKEILQKAKGERVFNDSLMRGVSLSAINVQYSRVINGGTVLTPFDFSYHRSATEYLGEISLSFKVKPDSKPPTNMHVLIGRNGVGKTTLLNGMVRSIIQGVGAEGGGGEFRNNDLWSGDVIAPDYFSSVVSVSFSAFDPFIPPPDRVNRSEGTCYYYVGLKVSGVISGDGSYSLKTMPLLAVEFVNSLQVCFSLDKRKERWVEAIRRLESDMNFKSMDLPALAESMSIQDACARAQYLFLKMSSGHAIVLLTITRLVETVEEKSLVLIDEPESHLHPPLLAAFTRAMSDLLTDRNGVAIIATHSPVVLQEVPLSCVWKITRSNYVTTAERPESQTFAENVGILTREVFGLEVNKSGFYDLLAQSIAEGKNFEQICSEYSGQIGFEGQAILRALMQARIARE